MTDHALEPHRKRLAGRWARAALACWGLSLLLPGFMVDSSVDDWPGWSILLFGTLFGWMVHGWSVYANLFFVVAAKALLQGRKPLRSVIAMLVLAATLPLFEGVLRDEGSSTIVPVASWGWGACLWLVSLVLLATAAALRHGWFSTTGARNVAVGLGACLLAVGVVRIHQMRQANTQERSAYLSPGMAFTNAPMCGLELTPVGAAVVPPGTVVPLDIDPQLRARGASPYLRLPPLSNDQEGGFTWVTWRERENTSVQVKVRVEAPPDSPVVQARKTAEGAVVRVLDRPAGRVLYEQPLRAITRLSGQRIYCPMPTGPGLEGLKAGYDTQLQRALGEGPQASPRQTLRDEVARTPCSLGAQDQDGIRGLRLWDGRKAIIYPESIRTWVGFCSDSYVALVRVSDYSAGQQQDWGAGAMVYDRRTLQPLAVFGSGRRCPRKSCAEAPHDIATGVRLSDTRILVESRAGDLPATRHEPR